MATTLDTAVDAILSTFKVRWDTDTPAITGGDVPLVCYEATEEDLKTHPKDSTLPWARLVIRHANGPGKVTLNNAAGCARYRRTGIVWVQVFTPSGSPPNWLLCQKLARVAQDAYEGKRAAEGNSVVFTKATIIDKPKENAWFRYDVKVEFYWDEIK